VLLAPFDQPGIFVDDELDAVRLKDRAVLHPPGIKKARGFDTLAFNCRHAAFFRAPEVHQDNEIGSWTIWQN
jgi:hypothetical protein